MATFRIFTKVSMAGPVIHFTDLKSRAECAESVGVEQFDDVYRAMQSRGNSIGGREHHGPSFGGGVIFYGVTPDEVFKRVNYVNGNRFDSFELV